MWEVFSLSFFPFEGRGAHMRFTWQKANSWGEGWGDSYNFFTLKFDNNAKCCSSRTTWTIKLFFSLLSFSRKCGKQVMPSLSLSFPFSSSQRKWNAFGYNLFLYMPSWLSFIIISTQVLLLLRYSLPVVVLDLSDHRVMFTLTEFRTSTQNVCFDFISTILQVMIICTKDDESLLIFAPYF